MIVGVVLCPKKGLKLGGVVLHRVSNLSFYYPKQGQGFKPPVAPLTVGQVPPPPLPRALEELLYNSLTP